MDPLEALLVNTFTGTLGSTTAMGLIGILFFIIIGVAFRLDTGAFLIVLLPLIFIFASYGLVPQVILYTVLMACAFIIYMAVMVVTRR